MATNWVKQVQQVRQVAIADYTVEAYLPKVKVEDAEVKKYYEDHKAELIKPATVKLEMLQLSAASLGDSASPSDADVAKYYQDHKAEFERPEQRRASHILIAVKATATSAEKDAAKKKADDLMAQVKKNPEKLAELAKANSADPGSASNGGDLGFFGRGLMVKAFDEAVFAAKEGDLLGPIQTDFGYHVIRVTGIQAALPKPLDEVKPQIISQLKQQIASQKYADLVEKFQDQVHSHGDSLANVGKALGLEVKTSEPVTQAQLAAMMNGNAKFAESLFTPEALTGKRAVKPVELAPNVLVTARVLEQKPAQQLSLDDVKPQILGKLQAQKASAMAISEGKAALAALKAGKAENVNFAAPIKLSLTAPPPNVTPEGMKAVMRVDATKLPGVTSADNGKGGFSIMKVVAVDNSAQAVEPERLAKANTSVTNALVREQFAAFLASIKSRTDVTINKSIIEKKSQ